MSSLLHHDEDEEDEKEQEITLSTASLLGFFLGLVLICGVFFGFGYSVGRRSSASAAAAASTFDSATAPEAVQQASAKPSLPPSLSTETAQPEANDAATASPDDSSLQSAGDSSLPSPADSSLQSAAPSPAAAPVVLPVVEKPVLAKPLPPPVKVAATATPASKTGQAMVQVAAVGRMEDADVLASALRQRGYGVVVRNEPQDKLLHVQIGPFPSRAQANMMRQKLLSDGYNAIIKQ